MQQVETKPAERRAERPPPRERNRSRSRTRGGRPVDADNTAATAPAGSEDTATEAAPTG
jgi:hypothetical protein